MAKKKLRDFPPTQPRIPWPTIYVSPEDRCYVPLPERPLARQLRLLRTLLNLLMRDFWVACGKGAVLGLFVFTIVYSYCDLQMRGFYGLGFWLWIFVAAGLLALSVLIGFDFAIMIFIGITLWLSFPAILHFPLMLLLYVGGGILAGNILEFFPRGKWQLSSP